MLSLVDLVLEEHKEQGVGICGQYLLAVNGFQRKAKLSNEVNYLGKLINWITKNRAKNLCIPYEFSEEVLVLTGM